LGTELRGEGGTSFSKPEELAKNSTSSRVKERLEIKRGDHSGGCGGRSAGQMCKKTLARS